MKNPKVRTKTSLFQLKGEMTKERFEALKKEAGDDSNVVCFDKNNHQYVIAIKKLQWIEEDG